MTEYGSLREKIAAEKAEKEARQRRFVTLLGDADQAGVEAVKGTEVVPMIVQQHANTARALLTPNDPGPVAKEWFVEDGVCGFAGVVMRVDKDAPKADQTEARRFINWLSGNQKPVSAELAPPARNGYKHYYGGWYYSIDAYNQSMQKKEAHARAMAAVLHEALPGLMAYCNSRMD